MDKFIDWFAERSTFQKILITLGICAFLLFLIAASYLLTNPTPSDKTNNTVSNSNNSSAPTSGSTSSQPNTAWQIYSADTFQVSYPQSLTGAPGIISGGGTALTLTGKEGVTDYNIEIQVTDSAQTPVDNIYEIFRSFEYKEEQTTLKNIIAKKFSGRTGDITETAVIFENRGKVYKIQLFYQSSGRSPQIDQMFEGVISTFTLL